MISNNKTYSTVKISTRILKFAKNGEKTGWTYVEITSNVATKLFPGNKKSFRVKGFLDLFPINGVALLPVGNGSFILPLNASLRKAVGKSSGDILKLQLQLDTKQLQLNQEFMQCMEDEPSAFSFFNELPKSHQQYFSKWIDSAKTPETRVKRISRSLNALSQKMNYSQMLRAGI